MTKHSQMYQVFYYDGESGHPAYHFIQDMQGMSLEDALRQSLQSAIGETREVLDLSPQYFSDDDVQFGLCVLKDDSMVSVSQVIGW